MTKQAALPTRSGQSDTPIEHVRSHILIVFANDAHGALDRIINVLRRRRAAVQTFTVGRSDLPDMVRVTVVTDDSEVGVEQLAEQLRKIVDVRHVLNLPKEEAIARELALIKVSGSYERQAAIIDQGHLFGAHPVAIDQESVTLEVAGSSEKVEKLVAALQSFGIRDVARTGYVAMSRGNAAEYLPITDQPGTHEDTK